MQYSINNVTVSFLIGLAEELKAAGWNIYWHATGDLETHTAGGQAKGTVTLLQDLPQDPTFVVLPSEGDYANYDNVVIPAFAIDVIPPRNIRRYGLGDPRFFRHYDIRVVGLAKDKRQQTDLASTIYEWLQVGAGHESLPIKDYETNPASPTDLDPAEIWFASVATPEVATTVDSARYRVHVNLILEILE